MTKIIIKIKNKIKNKFLNKMIHQNMKQCNFLTKIRNINLITNHQI